MLICKDCRCFIPYPENIGEYCGACCIGDMKNPIVINADITGCCLFEPKQPKKPKKLTNAEKIRQMTDEELAYILSDKCAVCYYQFGRCDSQFCVCTEGIMTWLKQEAKDDD